jgi:hypothetical protein
MTPQSPDRLPTEEIVLSTPKTLRKLDPPGTVALAASTQLVSAQPDVPEHRHRLANCHGKLGYAYAITSQAKETADSFRQGIDNYAMLVSPQPNVPAYLNGLAGCYNDLAVVLLDMGGSGWGRRCLPKGRRAFDWVGVIPTQRPRVSGDASGELFQPCQFAAGGW